MISVIVPVYNTAKYLEQVVQALQNQDLPRSEYELIFVDNGSTDGSLKILKSFSGIKVFSEATRGSYAARNLGISQAQGDILAFTDSDCYPVGTWLSTIKETLSADPAQIVMGPRLPSVSSRSLQLILEYDNAKAALIFASKDPTVYFGYTNNMGVLRSTLDRFGPFVQRARGSDTIFVRRVIDETSPDTVVYSPETAVRHAELTSVGHYFRKILIYGKSRAEYGRITRVRSLTMAERWSVFLQVACKNGFLNSVLLFFLLSFGMIFWAAGRIKGTVLGDTRFTH